MSVSLTDQDNSGLLQTYCYDNCSIDDTEDTKISIIAKNSLINWQ